MLIEIYLQSIDKFKKYGSLKDIPNEYNLDVTFISIINMNIYGVTRIGQRFPNLEILQVGCNKIKKIDLTYFPNLISLYANKNKITEIIGINKCLKLTTLEAQSNNIEYLEPSNSITRLCIPNNKLKILFDYPNLQILSVAHNFNFEQIINCPKLTYINADRTLLTKEQFDESVEFDKDN